MKDILIRKATIEDAAEIANVHINGCTRSVVDKLSKLNLFQ